MVGEWVPPGTPVAVAERTMREHGFACRVLRGAEPFALPDAQSGLRIDTLRCERRSGAFVEQHVHVDLVLDAEDRVRTVEAWCSMASLWLP